MNESMLTISEAAGMLGVSEVSLRQWTDEGKIKAFVTPGGHRRYSKTEISNFMISSQKAAGIKELISEIEATSKLHSEIGRTALITKDWYNLLDTDNKRRLAHLGRNMLEAIIKHLNEPCKKDRSVDIARKVGRGFGETLASLNLPLTDAVEAFILHRDPIMKAISLFMKNKDFQSSKVAGAIPLITRIMDEALISLVAAHQNYNSAAAGKGDKIF